MAIKSLDSRKVKKPSGKNWHVRLGEIEWKRYTYPRPEGDPLRLLGSVRRGAQFGALAITEDGNFLQVVGDILQPLCLGQITRALANAKAPDTDFESAYRPQRTSSLAIPAPVVVTVKRRRIPVAH